MIENTFTQLLGKFCTRSLIQVDNKKRALQFLSELFADCENDLQLQKILEQLINRGKLGCTQIGNGVALPHTRIDTLQKPLLALMTLAKPIVYDDSNHHKVDILCALLVPTDTAHHYLDTLKDLASLFQQASFCEALRNAPDDTALYTVATTWKTEK